jgi:hypothetical protein
MADKRQVVNLDALIRRADLFEIPGQGSLSKETIRISDLKSGATTYGLLRKPDFQRETANWNPEQVCNLIATFSKSDIIPSIILWHNREHIFVVDGAHRLSALIAWVHNDYGAGPRSLDFFEGKIPDEQRTMHEETKALVEAAVGSWRKFERDEPVQSLREMGVQWIGPSNAAQTANAFIRINQGGTVIDNLEARILRARRSALAVATRVIARGGQGHEYWKHFTDESAKRATPKLGAEIYKLLFSPKLEFPVNYTEVPLAGFGYGAHAIRFAFDLVAVCNALPIPDSTRRKAIDEQGTLLEDKSGAETVKYLQRVKHAVQLILSKNSMSLGLHPALYFYNSGGQFQNASLFNTIAWVLDLENKGKLDQFQKIRRQFEKMMLVHPVIVKPAAHKLGSGGRTRNKTITLFDTLLSILIKDRNTARAWKKIIRREDFKYLVTDEKEQKENLREGKAGGAFSRAAKSAGFLTKALPHVEKCELCGGLLHRNGMTSDHKHERGKGGSSAAVNSRMVHPICNSNRAKRG